MTAAEWWTAYTLRSDEPLLHAMPPALPRYSRTGRTYRAACGAQVRSVDRLRPWEPSHARACASCRRAVPG